MPELRESMQVMRSFSAPERPGEAGALVDAHELGRIYGQGEKATRALVSATFAIKPQDRIAVVGASGSGKSTLLYLAGGIDTPTSGRISWPALGSRESLRPEKIAFVFQMPSLLPALNVVENVELPLLLAHARPEDAHRAALTALTLVELAGIAEKLPEEISGGQAQRVAVARALCVRPRLILADEPTGQLDHRTAQHLLDVLLTVLQDTDCALVVATHDREIAERLEQMWRMEHGILEVDG